MDSRAVVKHLDPFEDSSFCLVSRLENLVVHELGFERVKETFHLCILPAASAPAHALLDPVKREKLTEAIRRILATLV